jgi:hypothetical protein
MSLPPLTLNILKNGLLKSKTCSKGSRSFWGFWILKAEGLESIKPPKRQGDSSKSMRSPSSQVLKTKYLVSE